MTSANPLRRLKNLNLKGLSQYASGGFIHYGVPNMRQNACELCGISPMTELGYLELTPQLTTAMNVVLMVTLRTN